LRVVDVDVRESGRGTRIGATVVWERNKRAPDELEFVYRDTPANAVVTAGDALAATVFMPAMAAGEDVAIDAPVSKRLYDGLGRLADVWLPLMPKWRPVDVSAELVDRSDLSPTVVAACFSAGVDSFYTVMRPRDEPITTLLTLRGFTASTQILARGDADLLIVAEAVRRMGFDHLVADTNAIPF